MKKFIIFSIFVVLFCSCSKENLTPDHKSEVSSNIIVVNGEEYCTDFINDENGEIYFDESNEYMTAYVEFSTVLNPKYKWYTRDGATVLETIGYFKDIMFEISVPKQFFDKELSIKEITDYCEITVLENHMDGIQREYIYASENYSYSTSDYIGDLVSTYIAVFDGHVESLVSNKYINIDYVGLHGQDGWHTHKDKLISGSLKVSEVNRFTLRFNGEFSTELKHKVTFDFTLTI